MGVPDTDRYVRLHLKPVSFAEAKAYITEHHRHHLPPQGWKFGVAVVDDDGVTRGVITCGRPVARRLDDGYTLEVTRCCTDGTKNASSMLYGAARRAAKALGYRKVITYTLASEPGISLRAAGWEETGRVKGRSWSVPSRPREDKHPLEDKVRWEAAA
jgi:hypothetical protein